MNEEFLHYVWKFRLFNQNNLTTTQGEPVEILNVGQHNFDAGPDFFNSKLKIGDTLWAGNTEIHLNSSDWSKHAHQKDKAYDNVILHLVFHDDAPVFRTSGELLTTIEIKDRIDSKLIQNYLDFKSNTSWIPCEKLLSKVPQIVIDSMLDKLLFERLERKSQSILTTFSLNGNDWEETFYQHLSRNFGFKTNASPFELLAKSLSVKLLQKHKDSLIQIEAMLYGQAGLLEAHLEDKYLQGLQNEYAFLQHKYKLKPIESHLWKFSKLRPVNFPTIRIAQFASMQFNSSHLFSKLMKTERLEDVKALFSAVPSDYWKTHYTFYKISPEKNKSLGDESINNLVINTVVPFLFVYGKYLDDQKYIDRAVCFLEHCDGENNSIIKQWAALNVLTKTAHSTQALLQLKNEYCNNKKCLNCSIGNYLFKNS